MGVRSSYSVQENQDQVSFGNILSVRREYEIFKDSEEVYEAEGAEEFKTVEYGADYKEGESFHTEDDSENIWERDLVCDEYHVTEEKIREFNADIQFKSDAEDILGEEKCFHEILSGKGNSGLSPEITVEKIDHSKKGRVEIDRAENSCFLNGLFSSFRGKSRLLLFVCLASSLSVATGFPFMNNTPPQQYYDPYKCGCRENAFESRSFGLVKRGRVVGGDEVPSGSAPWLAALTRDSGPHCGATLISKKHLLTAAHCIDGLELAELDAWIGVHSLSQAAAGAGGAKILRAWSHPNFDIFTFTNDIAVLELVEEVTFSPTLRPICLPSRDDAEYSRRTAVVAGWGRTAETKPPSDVPRQAQVQIWGSSRCRNSGYPARRVSGPVLCAGLTKGGVDACQGDSGGPLILPGSEGVIEVIGVVSWGRGCARPNLPGVYTRVASFLPFIHNILDGTC